ncbi:putative fatty acyl-CoA reductase CG5065 [Agrilus planipennis]|uniref:Fatty acyl-CoA reductase n=1 Tax=Agrilus planipennis TaxID=224129 RepID=A0A1W4WCD3_AGRPL|nr:putative fatty acyl-CoA reductase CG5065 [Agrilus planipennis]XP_025836656.1 putative fatty acyl-CoA reductase CG5065 [Agrilus planipennis]
MSSLVVAETIAEFYTGKCIFITGATGFMGKVLIEKLLRSCGGIDKIYVLMRTKKGMNVHERLNKITDLVLFDKLRETNPNFAKKLIPIEGDVTHIDLGLGPEDRKVLQDNVSIIFHAAASVRFDDPLKDAIILNTRGTREVIRLASEIKKLSAFVHVSTTYCNTDRKVVEEVLYPPHADWRKAIDIAEKMDHYTLQVMLSKYMNKLPNTYTFTKSMAEHVVYDLCKGKLPAVVFRPSIVISAMKEPMPGWLDNFNGPVGLLIASGKGILRSNYSDPEIITDFCPVDVAIKGLVVAAWKKGTTRKLDEKLDVNFYNCSSHNVTAVTQGEMIAMGKQLNWEVPLSNPLWYPGGGITKCKYWHYINVLFLHLIPALLIDLVLKIMNKKPMLLKVQRRIFSANMALHYFISRQWAFKNDNFINLNKQILPDEKEQFDFGLQNIDVWVYFKNAILGAKRFLLKESNTNLEQAKVTLYRLYVLHVIVNGIFYAFMFWLVIFKCNLISRASGYLNLFS